MRKIYFFICLLITFCIGNQAIAANKNKLNFEDRNSWFYIISDGRYLTWNPNIDILNLTNLPSSLNSQWTLDHDGRLYNRAKGEKYSIGCVMSVASLVRNGKAVLSDGHISYKKKSIFDVSSDGKLMFGKNSPLTFIMHPIEIPPQKVESMKYIDSIWKSKYNAFRKEIHEQWNQEYDLAQFWELSKFDTPERNGDYTIQKLVSRAPEIVGKAQEYAKNGKRGCLVGTNTLNQDFVKYNGDYYVCRQISTHGTDFLDWPQESYMDPFKTCLSGPVSKCTFKISRNKWIITYEEQIQVEGIPSGRGDCTAMHPMDMLDKYGYYYKPSVKKIGTYSTTYDLLGISIPAKATCSRRYWQTPRKGQGYWGEYFDPFAPWRIKQTIVFEFNINDYLKQFDKMPKELAILNLLDKSLELGSKYGWQGRCIPIAVLKTYSNEFCISDRIWKDIDKHLSKKQIKKAVILANTCPDCNILEDVCEKIFKSCKTPDELLRTFSEVYEALYGKPISTEHFAFYAFANLSWPDFKEMRTGEVQVPSFFKHYIEKRDKLFSNYANVVIKNSSYSKAFYSYLFFNIANKPYDSKLFAKLQTCSNQKFCNDIKTLLSQRVINYIQALVISYSKNQDIETFTKGLEQLDNIVNSVLIDKIPNYNSIRNEAIADVSKLLHGELITAFNNFDKLWLKESLDISSAVEKLSIFVKLNSLFYKGKLVSDAIIKECEFRIDAYEAMTKADNFHISIFIDKWGDNNIYADKLKQKISKKK